MHKPRLLIADDHALMVEGLQHLLEPHFDVVGTASNGRILIEMALALQPELIVLDIAMPELNGIEAARQLSTQMPKTKLVFVTQQVDRHYVRAAFRAGASGYVAKQSASTELHTALNTVLRGRFYITPALGVHRPEIRSQSGINPANLLGGDLTPRQQEVLQLIAEGKTLKEIATALKISSKTVEFHKAGLMDELGLRNTADLTRYAMNHGIVGG